jgi:hypothetical protein
MLGYHKPKYGIRTTRKTEATTWIGFSRRLKKKKNEMINSQKDSPWRMFKRIPHGECPGKIKPKKNPSPSRESHNSSHVCLVKPFTTLLLPKFAWFSLLKWWTPYLVPKRRKFEGRAVVLCHRGLARRVRHTRLLPRPGVLLVTSPWAPSLGFIWK